MPLAMSLGNLNFETSWRHECISAQQKIRITQNQQKGVLFSLSLCLCLFFCLCLYLCLSVCLSLSHTHIPLTPPHTYTLSHSLSVSLSLTHTLTRSRTRTHTLSYTLTLLSHLLPPHSPSPHTHHLRRLAVELIDLSQPQNFLFRRSPPPPHSPLSLSPPPTLPLLPPTFP